MFAKKNAVKNSRNDVKSARVALWAETAADLMSTNPVSIGADETIKDAVAFLTDKGISAAPVIDRAGRPVGVVSRTDIVRHDREKVDYLPVATDFIERKELRTRSGESLPDGFLVENVNSTTVRDIMTPVVYSVAPQTPVGMVVKEMLARRVHRLFVVGHDGILIGVISALDVLRHLAVHEALTSAHVTTATKAGRRPLVCETW
jgi:CBS domain-containing protein